MPGPFIPMPKIFFLSIFVFEIISLMLSSIFFIIISGPSHSSVGIAIESMILVPRSVIANLNRLVPTLIEII